MPHFGDDGSIDFAVSLLPTSTRLLALHRDELPQKDDLCGPFWAMLALRAADPSAASKGIDQDELARVAGTTVSAKVGKAALPPGHPGRRDYRAPLPQAEDPRLSGTSASGLIRAIDRLSRGRTRAVPLAAEWNVERVSTVFDLASRHTATVLLNVDTVELWESRPDPASVLGHLAGEDGTERRPEWSVGHFLALIGRISGPKGELALVADTYESLGWQGVHVQPMDRLARALTRSSNRSGGALLVVGSDVTDALRSEAAALGFTVAAWDNGSLDGGPS